MAKMNPETTPRGPNSIKKDAGKCVIKTNKSGQPETLQGPNLPKASTLISSLRRGR